MAIKHVAVRMPWMLAVLVVSAAVVSLMLFVGFGLVEGNEPPVESSVVNCDNNKTIGKKLESAKPGDTIRFTGTCYETITITIDDLTLEGQDLAIIDGEGRIEAVIAVIGAHRVTIKDLTVRNGDNDGIRAHQGASVILEGITAKDNGGDGIQIEHTSTARIFDSTATGNTGYGMLIEWASSANFGGTIISNGNIRGGIHLRGNSSGLFLPGGTVTTNDNIGAGVGVNTVSTLGVIGTLSSDGNGGTGISVYGVSRIVTLGGATITATYNNTGVTVGDASNFLLQGDQTLTSSHNTMHGLWVGGSASVQLIGDVIIDENDSHGVRLSTSARIAFLGETLIDNSGGDGLRVESNAFARLVDVEIQNSNDFGVRLENGGSAQISDSIFDDIDLTFAARVVGGGSTNDPGTVTCDETSLSKGNIGCPQTDLFVFESKFIEANRTVASLDLAEVRVSRSTLHREGESVAGAIVGEMTVTVIKTHLGFMVEASLDLAGLGTLYSGRVEPGELGATHAIKGGTGAFQGAQGQCVLTTIATSPLRTLWSCELGIVASAIP